METTMKLALLSDIHSNRQALDACLQHARAHGADHFALLGDLVGYGADPAYVVQQAMDLVAAGYTVIGGNHDAFAVQPPAGTDKGAHSMAAQGALWTHEQLSPEQRSFLAHLPLTAQVGGVLLVHASAEAPENWRYVDNEIVAAECLEAATKHPGVPCLLRPCAPADAVLPGHRARADAIHAHAGRADAGAAPPALAGHRGLGRPTARRRRARHVRAVRRRGAAAHL
jgi:predicted phosphodiesterase